jgi:hypothetical protein
MGGSNMHRDKIGVPLHQLGEQSCRIWRTVRREMVQLLLGTLHEDGMVVWSPGTPLSLDAM